MNDFKIEILRGADRIRKRPGVVFGSDGIAGAINAIKMLLEVFLAEAALGFSRGIDVVIHKDESVSIHSLDDGLVLSDALVKGKPAWHHLFCDFAVGPREVEESHFFSLGEKHNQLFGRDFPKQKNDADHAADLCFVQYASQWMRVESVRDGIKKSLEFKDGISASDLKWENTQEETGTTVHVLLSAEVFGESPTLPKGALDSFFNEAIAKIPTLKCKLSDERSGSVTIYR